MFPLRVQDRAGRDRGLHPAVEELEGRIVPTLLGQQLFPSENPWNQPIANAPVAADSAAIMNAIISTYGNGHLHPDFGQDTDSNNPLYGIPYNVVHGNSIPSVHVVVGAYAGQSDLENAPIPANAVLEGDMQNGPTVGLANRGDSHLLIWDEDNNIVYEFYQASRPSENSDGQWHAAQESVWNLNTNTFRTLGWTSADAAGLPILPGLVRPDEGLPVSQGGQGAIDHALRMTLENSVILDQFLYPASHVADPGNTNAADEPPMGARFRLKASVDISSLNPESKIIAQALQDYGLIVADNGSNFFLTGASYSVDANNDAALTWNDADIQDSVHGLKSLTFSDFEVVDLTPVVTGLSLSSGTAGTQVTITGQNFSGAAGRLQVLFGGVPAGSVTVVDDAHVTAVVPPGSGTVDVRVQSGVSDPSDPENINSPIFGYGTSATSAADRFTYTNPPLHVTSVSPAATGFTVTFSDLLDTSVLNLYSSSPMSVAPPDLTLTDSLGRPVRGSLLVGAAGGDSVINFVLTGQTGALPNLSYDQGTLPTGIYTVILQSGSNAFVDTSGNLLDGGTNYTTTFTVTQPLVELSLPDFARGPGQPVNLASDVNVGNNPPANDAGTGIPIRFYNPTSTPQAVSTLTFQIPYNPSLLTITGFVPGTNASGGTISLDISSTPGLALVGFTASPGSVPTVASGGLNLLDLLALVPTGAPYDGKELLDLQHISLNGGAAPVADDNAIQTVTYLGDTDDGALNGPAASNTYTGPDATNILSVSVSQASGFPSAPLVDPFIIGDILGVGSIGGQDATIVLEASVGQSPASLPAIPGGGFMPALPKGPDPAPSIPKLAAAPGATALLPVKLGQGYGLVSAPSALSYDMSPLQAEIDPRSSIPQNTVSTASQSGPESGSVDVIAFQVRGDAPADAGFVDLAANTKQSNKESRKAGKEETPPSWLPDFLRFVGFPITAIG